MTSDDQEYFADYLELEHYIEDLQAGHAAHLPADLTPEQARVYHMASLFHSSSPDAAQPRSEFIASLQERLLSINQEQEAKVQPPKETPIPVYQTGQEQSRDQQATIEQPSPTPPVSKTRTVSRRALLTGGAVAAASLAVGIGAGSTINKPPQSPQSPAAYQQEELLPTGSTTWLFVAPLAKLSGQAVKFVTDVITGYVMLNDKDDKETASEPAIALSAACTHMGCIVKWEDKQEQFQCPCHGGLFDEYGQPVKESPIQYLKPLARLRTKIENGNVYVEVPAQSTANLAARPSSDRW